MGDRKNTLEDAKLVKEALCIFDEIKNQIKKLKEMMK